MRQRRQHKSINPLGINQGLLKFFRFGLHGFAGVAEFGDVGGQASADFAPG